MVDHLNSLSDDRDCELNGGVCSKTFSEARQLPGCGTTKGSIIIGHTVKMNG